MSDNNTPPVSPDGSAPPPLPHHPPQGRDGCLTAILIVFGIILLLPGLCSLIFVFGGMVRSAGDLELALVLGAAGWGGLGPTGWGVWGHGRGRLRGSRPDRLGDLETRAMNVPPETPPLTPRPPPPAKRDGCLTALMI